MNELKRYEQALAEQLSDLPVPDENFAWEEMRKLLDKKDDDRPAVPFLFGSGCFLWGIGLLAVLLTAGWFFFLRDAKDDAKKDKIATSVLDPAAPQQKNVSSTPVKVEVNATVTKMQDSGTISIAPDLPVAKKTTASSQKILVNQRTGSTGGNSGINNNRNFKKIGKGSLLQNGNNQTDMANAGKRKHIATSKTKVNIRPATPDVDDDDVPNDQSDSVRKNNNVTLKNTDSIAPTQQKTKDSSLLQKKKPADTTITKKTEEQNKHTKKYWWSAGIAVFQPIGINGQSPVAFSADGRKGSVTDYIPSVFLRFNREKKWFLQSEFRYGAPQYVKEFVYNRKVVDTALANFTTATYSLKKTYYHQVPVSFNYYVLPNLSIGVGAVYNNFYAAISNEAVRKRTFNGDTLISSKMIKDKADSNFRKNNIQWLAEIQYKWKRFSFGARYAQDLQPYIHYVDVVSGEAKSKKSVSLNVFVRYELWRKK